MFIVMLVMLILCFC